MIFVNSFTSFPIVVAPPATGDPDFANVTLLLHADNNNTDTSPIGASISPTGILYNTSIKKFGAAAFSFNGISSSFVTPSNANYAFGSGDFTVECWVYFNSTTYPAQRVWTNNLAFGANSMYLTLNGGYAYFQVGGAGALQGATQGITTGVWYHIAITRSGNVWRQFVNGVLDGTATSSTNPDNGTSSQFYIGRGFNGSPNEYFDGFIDDFRITKGVARYTASFLPPQFPFPDNVGTQIVEFPPQAMTTNSTSITTASYGNGTYVSNASSQTEFSAHLAFNKVNGTAGNNAWSTGGIFNTTTGVFTGATSRGGASGAWIEIIFPSPILLTSYSIAGRNDVTFQSPLDFTLVATNDPSGLGTGWVSLDTRTGLSWALSENATPKMFTISPATSYLRYAIVVSKIGPSNLSGYVVIPELRFFGY